MTVAVKICGVRDPEMAQVAIAAGAAHIGLVFFERSPRFVTIEQARDVGQAVSVSRVGLFVDPDDALLEKTLAKVPLDMLQLHGGETPERVAEVKRRFGLPVMKAFGIADAGDLAAIAAYEDSTDWLLFDARPPREAVLPGGNGVSFDWNLLSGHAWKRPWMLSGGLTAANVAQAIRISGAKAVDVSSGVETGPGVKNAALVRDFIAATLSP